MRTDLLPMRPATPALTSEGEGFASEAPRLRYAVAAPPAPGAILPIAPGIHWLRMPLPIDLNHINLWLIDEPDGSWTLVDTGLPAQPCADVWQAIEASHFAQRRLGRLVLTHFHPDHMGLAGWLQQRHAGLPVSLSRDGLLAWDHMTRDPRGPGGDIRIAYFESHGMPDVPAWLGSLKGIDPRSPLASRPVIAHHPVDGEVLKLGGYDWEVIESSGHADGHHALHCAALGVLISGDVILPAISPNISTTVHHWGQDTLGAYLDSLARFAALPAETLVLPSHGLPFRGLHARAADLRAHHEAHLERLRVALSSAQTAFELLPVLFGRRLFGFNQMFGMHECIAHLEHLVRRGESVRTTDAAGVHRYQRAA
jgi:glyoxylase-like metal-dependent hydrolase (beta-lactamase superfamily II)